MQVYENVFSSQSLELTQLSNFSIKSGNNVGELWKHLKDINSVSKCHIKCINIDGKKCDIEDICNNPLLDVVRQIIFCAIWAVYFSSLLDFVEIYSVCRKDYKRWIFI
jgi:hypothetical protein